MQAPPVVSTENIFSKIDIFPLFKVFFEKIENRASKNHFIRKSSPAVRPLFPDDPEIRLRGLDCKEMIKNRKPTEAGFLLVGLFTNDVVMPEHAYRSANAMPTS